MATCEKCGGIYDEIYGVCSKCGMPVPKVEMPAEYLSMPPSPTASVPKEKKPKGRLIAAFSILAVVLIGIIIL